MSAHFGVLEWFENYENKRNWLRAGFDRQAG
jgi:hypothetical protein